MATEGERMRQGVAALIQRLVLSEQHGIRLASSMDAMKDEFEAAMQMARQSIAELENRRHDKGDRMDLVDVKTMQPQVFSGKVQESYK